MKLSATVDEVREIAELEPLEDSEKGGKILIELDNGTGSDTDDKK